MLTEQGLKHRCRSVMFQTHTDVLNVRGVLILFINHEKTKQ